MGVTVSKIDKRYSIIRRAMTLKAIMTGKLLVKKIGSNRVMML